LLGALLATFLTGATARHAMVATAHHDATQAGISILRAGGNAVDAAIAVAYALAVVDPCCGNIGGGGFMLIRLHDGRERFLDFRETAPLRATPTMFLDRYGDVRAQASRKGWLAVGVPGTVAGMEIARREFATMSRARLMAPAIALAGEFNPQLARTLALVAKGGSDAFYRGPIARAIVRASDANGGILTLRDFSEYRVEEPQPIHCTFGGSDLISAPPPSSGGVTLCEILNILAPYPLQAWGWHDLRFLHYATEAERRAFADRNAYLGDPDFVPNPVAQLLAPSYAAKLRSEILPGRATPSSEVRPGLGTVAKEGEDTTHYSIVDRWGNAVAVTYTLNDSFGAGVVAGDTGFLLNDEMDDFTSKPGAANMYGLVQGERNAIAPGKRPLSSMTPTIVTQRGMLRMVTGSPGGPRIVTTTLETLLDVLVYGMSAQAAVDAPRTHMQWLPDELEYEPGAFNTETARALQQMGYTLNEVPKWGSAQAIVVNPQTGLLEGGSDRRTPAGSAAGY
jgi:gamma-glutamyltranspeptidase/glutathione hydrolase